MSDPDLSDNMKQLARNSLNQLLSQTEISDDVREGISTAINSSDDLYSTGLMKSTRPEALSQDEAVSAESLSGFISPSQITAWNLPGNKSSKNILEDGEALISKNMNSSIASLNLMPTHKEQILVYDYTRKKQSEGYIKLSQRLGVDPNEKYNIHIRQQFDDKGAPTGKNTVYFQYQKKDDGELVPTTSESITLTDDELRDLKAISYDRERRVYDATKGELSQSINLGHVGLKSSDRAISRMNMNLENPQGDLYIKEAVANFLSTPEVQNAHPTAQKAIGLFAQKILNDYDEGKINFKVEPATNDQGVSEPYFNITLNHFMPSMFGVDSGITYTNMVETDSQVIENVLQEVYSGSHSIPLLDASGAPISQISSSQATELTNDTRVLAEQVLLEMIVSKSDEIVKKVQYPQTMNSPKPNVSVQPFYLGSSYDR